MMGKKVTIIGQGYVGLPLSMELADAGWQVFGVDMDVSKVRTIREGRSPIEDVSDDTLRRNLARGNYSIDREYNCVTDSWAVILCVPTPLNDLRQPDTSFLDTAINQIAPYLSPNTLIVNESTSFPGTLRDLLMGKLRKDYSSLVKTLYFASAPERIDPGNKNFSIRNTPRLIGGVCDQSKTRAQELYKSICENIILVDSPEIAEMAKLLENTFRQVNIALINQLVPLCEKLNINLRDVVEAAGTKPYGFMKFYPGPGVGGHCIPIDPLYLLWKAHQNELDLPFIAKADEVNRSMPNFVVSKILSLSGIKRNERCLILGVAYKSGISDCRESPALEIAKNLISQGLQVAWLDPLVKEFPYGDSWNEEMEAKAAIIVTFQEGLEVERLASRGIFVLDCTGKFRGIKGVFNF